MKKLDIIAQSDEIYILREKCYQESAKAFAESGRLMYQRKVNLACEYMEFKKREQP